jgi:hypothetical protein
LRPSSTPKLPTPLNLPRPSPSTLHPAIPSSGVSMIATSRNACCGSALAFSLLLEPCAGTTAPEKSQTPAKTAALSMEVVEAARRGQLKKLVKWLRKGRVVDVQLPDGTTLLHTAVLHGQLDCTRELIKSGATINLPTADGTTAIMLAAANEQPNVLALLLAAGASMDLQAADGFTALMLAANHGASRCVELLLAEGARTDLHNKEGQTALECAQSKRYGSTVLLLQRASKMPEPAAIPATMPGRFVLPERMLHRATCSETRRNTRRLHQATGLLARAMRD